MHPFVPSNKFSQNNAQKEDENIIYEYIAYHGVYEDVQKLFYSGN